MDRLCRFLVILVTLGAAAALALVPSGLAGHVGPGATGGVDAKVTDDNNNLDGGEAAVTPSKDARNRQSNEPTVAISGAASPVTDQVGDIIAGGGNDYRLVPLAGGDVWLGFYLSFDGGTTWFGAPPFPNGFNTMVPGFPQDTSAAGVESPLSGLDAAGDPIVRFDSDGNLYVAGIAFNRNFDQPDRPVDNLVFVASYDFTPGTAATASTGHSAGSPPHFTYRGTTVVDRGAVGFAVPGASGFAGDFTDKPWMEVDLSPSSPCSGNVYVAYTSFHGVGGSSPIKVATSTDGGATFAQPRVVNTGGADGTVYNQGADIAVASDGTVYVAYTTFARTGSTVSIVRSDDCGRKWAQPVPVGSIVDGQAPGVVFRTPTFAFLAVDDAQPDTVYAAYMSIAGDYDVFVQRSTNGGQTWSAPVQVHSDPGARHQIWPTIEVSHGALHVGWFDFRNSTTPANEALDFYYACTNCDGSAWPAFSHETRISDVSHNGNCRMFGNGTGAFHGDYNELDARWNGSAHEVSAIWTDNRNVTPCDTDPAAGPPTSSIGNRNQNIYSDSFTVAP